MPKVRVNDIQMYYEIRGEGFSLLLIMGFLGNADLWDPLYFIPKLSEHFKLIMFDNRGAGRTDVSDKEYSIKLFADDAAGLMEALGIKRARVLGISMGGMIAQELALNHPEKVEKLVLASTYCGGEKAIPIPGEAAQVVIDVSAALAEKGDWDEEIARKLMPIVLTQEFMDENPGIVGWTVGPMGTLIRLRRTDELVRDWVYHKEELHEALDFITDVLCEYVEMQVEAGAIAVSIVPFQP